MSQPTKTDCFFLWLWLRLFSYKYGTNVLAACHLNYLKSAVWPDEVRSLFTLCLDASYPKSVLLHMT